MVNTAGNDDAASLDLFTSTFCVVICEGFIGRFPRNKGLRNFTKFTLGKPVCRGELRRKRGRLGEMAKLCRRCGFD